MVYGHAPFAALSTLGKMKAIPDAMHEIAFPLETAPFLPLSADQNSPTNPHASGNGTTAATGTGATSNVSGRARDWTRAIKVPEVVIDTLKRCLVRSPKERATIPELLESTWLDDSAISESPFVLPLPLPFLFLFAFVHPHPDFCVRR